MNLSLLLTFVKYQFLNFKQGLSAARFAHYRWLTVYFFKLLINWKNILKILSSQNMERLRWAVLRHFSVMYWPEYY